MTTTAQYGTALYGDSYYDLLVLNCSGGSYTITGGAATFLYDQAIQGNAGSYTLTGQNAGFQYDQVLQGNAGAYTLTGSDAGLDYDQLLNCEAGSFTLTGNSATFIYDQTIYAGAFSFIWSGQQAGTVKDSLLVAEAGSYAITGGAASLNRQFTLTANAGSYAYIGKTAALSYNPSPVTFVESKGGIDKKRKAKYQKEAEQREELEAIVKREFDILDGTYQPEVIETVKEVVLPKIKEIDYTEYAIALAQVNALLLQAKIQAAEYQSELDDEEALLMLL
jgi:hypothetical protein